jgi:methylmalonyl-CoA mutase
MSTTEENSGLFADFPPVSTEVWEGQIHTDLKGADYEKKLVWQTDEGLRVRPYYRSEDLEDLSHLNTLPGDFPFVRGDKVSGNHWQVRQDIRTDDHALANRLALEAIERGADAVGIRAKEVNSMEELSDLLRYIQLEKSAVHFISAREYPFIAELFIRIMKLRTARPELVQGSLGFDPFTYFLLYGDYYNSLHDNLNEAKYLIQNIGRELPAFKMVHVSGNVFHNAGASAVQELAFALASGNEYMARLTDEGLTADQVAGTLHFTFGIGSSYFLEIAKLRAARMLWATIVDHYKPEHASAGKMYIHGTTSLWNKSLYDPYVNMLRGTTETMSAAIGGCDAISVSPFDQVFKNPDSFSMRLARNTQIILKEESYLNKVADPAAGSYYVEKLTDSLAAAAWDLFRKIEQEGGFLRAVSSGTIRADIEATAARRNERIAKRSVTILGTNQYPNQQEMMLGTQQADPLRYYPGLTLYRAPEPWEALRLATERYVLEGNPRPGVFLLNIGNLAMRKARAGFSSNFFGCAGYELYDNNGFAAVADGVAAAEKSGAQIVVICSSDEEYLTLGVEAATHLKGLAQKPLVVVAGNPAESIDQLIAAGVDDFIHVRVNALTMLKKFNQLLGVTKS